MRTEEYSAKGNLHQQINTRITYFVYELFVGQSLPGCSVMAAESGDAERVASQMKAATLLLSNDYNAAEIEFQNAAGIDPGAALGYGMSLVVPIALLRSACKVVI